MPEKATQQRAQRARRQGKAPTTQAGEFIKEEFHHAKAGKHPVKSRKQAIAIGLSKARRSGVKVPAKGAAAQSSGRGKRKTKSSAPSRRGSARSRSPGRAQPRRRAKSSRRASAR